MMLPAPMLTPLLVVAPGMIINMFAPMLAIFFCRIAFDPWPISVMAMTAATAMMTPKADRADRNLLRRSATSAVRHVAGSSAGSDAAAVPPGHRHRSRMFGGEVPAVVPRRSGRAARLAADGFISSPWIIPSTM